MLHDVLYWVQKFVLDCTIKVPNPSAVTGDVNGVMVIRSAKDSSHAEEVEERKLLGTQYFIKVLCISFA